MLTESRLKWLTGGVILLVLIAVNVSIFQKQQLLKNGAVVILELAPVDPRSLMQGDYMALDYALTRTLQQQWAKQSLACQNERRVCPALPSTGLIVVSLDAKHQALGASLWQDQGLKPSQVMMKYHFSAGSLQIGTSSYFFQEGQGERFANARYGEFRVAKDGTALLTHLLDEQGQRI